MTGKNLQTLAMVRTVKTQLEKKLRDRYWTTNYGRIKEILKKKRCNKVFHGHWGPKNTPNTTMRIPKPTGSNQTRQLIQIIQQIFLP